MKIGFIAEPYEEENASGMGYVVLELIKNLSAQDKKNNYTIYSSKLFKKEWLASNAKNVLMPKSFIKKFFWFLKRSKDVDVLLFVAPLLPLIIPKRTKSILICQELAGQKIKARGLKNKIKAFLRDRILMPIVLRRASVVVAASIATKKDLLKFYNISKNKIKIIYDGFQDLRTLKDKEFVTSDETQPYFFFVGKVKYRKNVHGIAEGFIKFKRKTNVDCKLVIAGSYGGNYYDDIIKKLRENNCADEVFFVGYATGGALYSFYKNAVACVFPSINEGFGMPIIEAMSLGTPVITSNISSMVEVAGGAGLLVNPFNTDEIAGAMEKMFFGEELRNKLIEKGFKRAKMFSWPKAAEEYLEVIKNL